MSERPATISPLTRPLRPQSAIELASASPARELPQPAPPPPHARPESGVSHRSAPERPLGRAPVATPPAPDSAPCAVAVTAGLQLFDCPPLLHAARSAQTEPEPTAFSTGPFASLPRALPPLACLDLVPRARARAPESCTQLPPPARAEGLISQPYRQPKIVVPSARALSSPSCADALACRPGASLGTAALCESRSQQRSQAVKLLVRATENIARAPPPPLRGLPPCVSAQYVSAPCATRGGGDDDGKMRISDDHLARLLGARLRRADHTVPPPSHRRSDSARQSCSQRRRAATSAPLEDLDAGLAAAKHPNRARHPRLASLAAQIKAGRYRIPSGRIAEALLRDFRGV